MNKLDILFLYLFVFLPTIGLIVKGTSGQAACNIVVSILLAGGVLLLYALNKKKD